MNGSVSLHNVTNLSLGITYYPDIDGDPSRAFFNIKCHAKSEGEGDSLEINFFTKANCNCAKKFCEDHNVDLPEALIDGEAINGE